MFRLNLSLLTIILYSSVLFPQTSLLTGQASQSISLAPGAVLQYSSDIAVDVQTRNEVSPAGWVGLGWKFGIPSIAVAHNNTVAIADDRWFFNDGYGNTSEIIRVYEGTPATEKFYLLRDTLSKITAIDNNPTGGGWPYHSV
jgi:hypothetical protein